MARPTHRASDSTACGLTTGQRPLVKVCSRSMVLQPAHCPIRGLGSTNAPGERFDHWSKLFDPKIKRSLQPVRGSRRVARGPGLTKSQPGLTKSQPSSLTKSQPSLVKPPFGGLTQSQPGGRAPSGSRHFAGRLPVDRRSPTARSTIAGQIGGQT